MKLFCTLFLVVIALVGCSNPKDTLVPTDISKWEQLKPIVEKLSEDDKKLFLGYTIRMKFSEVLGGKGLEEGLTIGKAIEKQKIWVVEQEKKEMETKLLKQRILSEQIALKKQVDDLLIVTVLKTKLEKDSYFENQVFEIGFQNKSLKDIRGIKGVVKFIDIFDKEVGAVSFGYDDGLKAGATGAWRGVRQYNQFIESHRAVANLEEGKYTTRFEPEMIIFSDGTKLEIKE